MRRFHFLTLIFVPTIALVLASTTALVWLADRTVRQFHIAETRLNLQSWATLASSSVERLNTGSASLDSLSKQLGTYSNVRFTFIAHDGTVLGDSRQDPHSMENHSTRPEVVAALTGEVGISVRHSSTLGFDLLYLALPNKAGGIITRVAIPLREIDDAVKDVYGRLALFWAVVGVAAVGVSFWVSRRLSAPVYELRRVAQSIADGDFRTEVPHSRSRELAELASAIGSMSKRLEEQFLEVTRQRNELEAVLSSMSEGVIALDPDSRVLFVNRAAERMLGISVTQAIGRVLPEVIREPELIIFADSLHFRTAPIESEAAILLSSSTFRIQGIALQEAGQPRVGSLIVLTDVTRMRQLETVRQDFVANVSHELRTPVTAIRASVETIESDSEMSADTLRRFVSMIGRNAERMGAIIEDLLVLARLDQEDMEGIALTTVSLADVANSAHLACNDLLLRKRITLAIEGEATLGKANGHLLEEALLNLLYNAIRYSPEGSKVVVRIETDLQEVSLLVEDFGVGISEEHLPRLFERFYRVDRDRSRIDGGTGLGLAIVKHIALAHKGRVSVRSQEGKGSVFGLHLPK